jgi:hypothetical protein
MTAADKRMAARLLLEECPEMSDRAIAALVGCSHPTVATTRQALSSMADHQPASVGPEPTQHGSQVVNFTTSAGGPSLAQAAPRHGRDGKAYRVPARSRPAAKAARKKKEAASPRPTGPDDAPKVLPELVMDYRAQAGWVTRYLRYVLQPVEGEHRREALDMILAGLTRENLRMLEERSAAAQASTAAAPAT